MTYRNRIYLSFVLLMSTLGLLILTGGIIFSFHDRSTLLSERGELLAKSLSITLKVPAWNFDLETIDSIIQSFSLDPDLAKVDVSLSDGTNKNVWPDKRNLDLSSSKWSIHSPENFGFEREVIGTTQVHLSKSRLESYLASHIVDGAVALLVIILTTVMVVYFVLQGLGRPLYQLLNAIVILSKNDFSVEIPGTERNDEIGEVARTIEKFKRNGIELFELRASLEHKIEEQTRDLELINRDLRLEMEERERVEERLQLAQKLESIGQLAAGIAHEINTPTQFIGDNTRFLQDAFRDLMGVTGKSMELVNAAEAGEVPESLIKDIRNAMDAADLEFLNEEIPIAIGQSLEGIERVAKIVGAMKDFSHPGAGKNPTDLNRAIGTTITVAGNEWKYVSDLVTDFDESLPPVPCIAGEFNQVILNMIVNAAQAIVDVQEDGAMKMGTITVSTRHLDGWVEIRLSDTGSGIPEQIKDRVFDQFFTTKAVGIGTGQGLSIAHAVIVNKHGGEIAVESEVGKGTTFIIKLPLQDSDELYNEKAA